MHPLQEKKSKGVEYRVQNRHILSLPQGQGFEGVWGFTCRTGGERATHVHVAPCARGPAKFSFLVLSNTEINGASKETVVRRVEQWK